MQEELIKLTFPFLKSDEHNAGDELSSHSQKGALFSPLVRLTSLFGMGRGCSTPPESPALCPPN